MDDPLLTPSEVAERLHLTTDTLAKWRYKDKGPAFLRLGARTVRYRTSAVETWIKAHAVETVSA